MTLNEFKAKLAQNGRDGVFFSKEQLVVWVLELSADIPGSKPNAVTLAYSGPLDPAGTGLWSTKVAETIGANSNGYVRTIEQTDIAKGLNSTLFRDALLIAVGGSNAERELVLIGADVTGTRVSSGLWDEASKLFMSTADGPVRSLVPFSSVDRVFAQSEIQAIINNPKIPNFDGIPREQIFPEHKI
ncbi:MAG: hypothetical protein H7Z12_07325 [Rhodospirillaceae bacterium]|nr:hypothetical protein [Rhodospirillales bacterium]